jgi:curved DNA-binding protein CbpA
MQSYYDLLDVTPGATAEEIKASYRKLAKACHPDLNAHDPLAARRFAALSKAYHVLTNPELRGLYDAHLKRRLRVRREPWSTISRRAMMMGFGCATAAGALFFVVMGMWGPAATSARIARIEPKSSIAVVQAPIAGTAVETTDIRTSDTPPIGRMGSKSVGVSTEPASPIMPNAEDSARDEPPAPTPRNRRASSRRAGSSG